MKRRCRGLALVLAIGAGTIALGLTTSAASAALGLIGDGAMTGASRGFAQFTPASADPRLAELMARRVADGARLIRFTPAGISAGGANRSVTVAVRIDQQAAQALSSRSTAASGREGASEAGGLQLAQMRYNLGLARGFGNFAPGVSETAPITLPGTVSRNLSQARIPDLAEFRPSPGVSSRPSRFAARVEVDDSEFAARPADSSVRLSDRLLDVGGSYRLTRNLELTAGVRYQQDRDLRPLPEGEQHDSQAVYIGTQFRF